MFYITKYATFDSAHYLNYYRGKCANIHGHTWKVGVTIRVDNDTLEESKSGISVDFGLLKELIKVIILDAFDHRLVNDVISFNPTAENLAKHFYGLMKPAIKALNGKANLYKITLYESADSIVEYVEE